MTEEKHEAVCRLRILPEGIDLLAPESATIAEAASLAGIALTLPCGGKGSCGHCIVLANGQPVKACNTPVADGMSLTIPGAVRQGNQAILTDIRLYNPDDNRSPRLERARLKLEAPTLEDSRSDTERLLEALAEKLGLPAGAVNAEPGCLPKLPRLLREGNFEVEVRFIRERGGACVLDFGDGPLYGVAVDIGTTTLAAALCEVETGLVLDTVGAPNPQAQYGSDVISRIVYTEENEDGLETLREEICAALSEMVGSLAKRAAIRPASIPVMTIAANTVMASFLAGLPCDALRREPYVPAARFFPAFRPAELGLPILPHGRVLVLPAVSSYVGGDITAGVIASGLPQKPGLNMLVDVGTNGEMVLAGEGFMMACSCSAGPAFEGSGISCGSRAVAGAIDSVVYQDGKLVYDTIGAPEAKPASLCGSGLISLLSALLESGAIDRAGRFTNGESAFTLAPGVFITQDDIANLIRAKGAIFAGIRVLASQLELSLSDIDHIYIAGGFGRSLNIETAVNIGMFPPLPESRFSYVGNASLAGALRVLCDESVNADATAQSITNIELSVGNAFMEEFTMASFLPHTDLASFNSISTGG